MSEYARGPWEIGARVGRYQVVPANEQERCKLASINALEFDALSIGTRNGQIAMIPLDESNIANARLIAAAPELLAELEKLVGACNLNSTAYLRSCKRDAELAIAKAKGAFK